MENELTVQRHSSIVSQMSEGTETNGIDMHLFDDMTQQVVFRSLMRAMSHPGELIQMPAEYSALEAVLACVVDTETSLADPCALLSDMHYLQLECIRLPAESARFVVADGSWPVSRCVVAPQTGTLESPELSATLIVKVSGLTSSLPMFNAGVMSDSSHSYHLCGPGIEGHVRIGVAGLDDSWMLARQDWNASFPMGIDMILVCGNCLLALPRSTTVTGVL